MFAEKFHLLSSQQSDEINWSSSESSDYENKTNSNKVCNFMKRKPSRKRKRKVNVRKNISNLDITVIDLTKETKETVKNNKTEIMTEQSETSNTGSRSPILGSTQYFLPYKCSDAPTSPIIGSKTLEYQSKVNKSTKSPIIVLKTASPRISPNVRKKLKYDAGATTDVNSNRSANILRPNHCLDRRKSITEQRDIQNQDQNYLTKYNNETKTGQAFHKDYQTKEHRTAESNASDSCLQSELSSNRTFIVKKEISSSEETKHTNMVIEDLSQDVKHEVYTIEETPEQNIDESMAMLKTYSTDLAKKVKKYFDNEFSSGNPSQQTISEISSQKNSSKTSDDIEIVNISTQVLTSKNSFESSKELSIHPDTEKKEKKIRYKKDGLAYRLNNLLKKQTASISLWQHEIFLAENSNFVIPKADFLAFRICKVNFKYGCYLIEAMDLNDDNYLILINRCHYNGNIIIDCILKLYEPYTKVDFPNYCKLIINVTKFECLTI